MEQTRKLTDVECKIGVARAIKILRSGLDDRLLMAAMSLASDFGIGMKNMVITKEQATPFLLNFVRHTIDQRNFGLATQLLWPVELITFKPYFIQFQWATLNDPAVNQLLIMGAGSLGKSFTTGIWAMMDWIYDPENTCFKVVSMTAQHAAKNMFAIMKNLHANCLIPLPGTATSNSINIERADGTRDDKQGIHLVAIPQGQDGSGRLQGFHPTTRVETHPKYGNHTRVRVILDEAEKIPQAVWDDVDNTLISKTDKGHVKVIALTNPEDKTSKFGLRAEPKDGWDSQSIEMADEWDSKFGWHVIRLDGAKFENVVLKQVKYPGFLTWEGYQGYLALGPGSPTYYTMARGWFPETGMAGIIIPQSIWDQGKGQFIFQGRTFYCLSLDLAFEGGDLAIATIGRWGECTGWVNRAGKVFTFPVPKHGLQIEQQFEVKKGDSFSMVNEFIASAQVLHIRPEWIVIDKTSATTFYDLLQAKMMANNPLKLSDEDALPVLGINYGEKATDMKIMEESEHKASELYDGVVTELWWSGRQFLEFDMMKIGPMVKLEKLEKQMIGRRYKHSGEKVRVEPKKEYKARGNNSPDEADSLLQIVHLVRMRRQFVARMIAESPMNQEIDVNSGKMGIVDKLDFLDMTK